MALLAYSAKTGAGDLTKNRAFTFIQMRLTRVVWGDVPSGQCGLFNATDATPRIQPGRDDSIGDAVPSLRVRGPWSFTFKLPVNAVAYSLSVSARQSVAAYARPKLKLRANPGIGVAADSATAGAGSGWVTVGPLTFTPSARGVIVVELLNPEIDRDCHFDNLALVAT